MKKTLPVFLILIGILVGFALQPFLQTRLAQAAPEGMSEVLSNQQKILQVLEEIKKELYIVKIRASR